MSANVSCVWLSRVQFEQSDTWQQQVMAPLNAMWEDVQTIAQRNGMDPNQLAHLLQNKDDEALANYMDEHSTRPGDRHYLFGMIRDIDRIEKTKQYLRHNAHEMSQQSQQEMAARRNYYFQSIGAARSKAVEAIVPKITEKILAVLPKDKRRNLQNDVKYILDFDKWEPDIQMFAGVSAVVLPDLLGQLQPSSRAIARSQAGVDQVPWGWSQDHDRGKDACGPGARGRRPLRGRWPRPSLTDFAEESTKRIRQALGYRK